MALGDYAPRPLRMWPLWLGASIAVILGGFTGAVLTLAVIAALKTAC